MVLVINKQRYNALESTVSNLHFERSRDTGKKNWKFDSETVKLRCLKKIGGFCELLISQMLIHLKR